MCGMSEIQGEGPSTGRPSPGPDRHPGNRARCQHSRLGRGIWKIAKESLGHCPGVAGQFRARPRALTPLLLQVGATSRYSGKRTSLRPRGPRRIAPNPGKAGPSGRTKRRRTWPTLGGSSYETCPIPAPRRTWSSSSPNSVGVPPPAAPIPHP